MIEILFALAIPLTEFDQHKLESLVRKIPEALDRVETNSKFQRRYYSFPKITGLGFRIECEADHYLNSPLPSASSCSLSYSGDHSSMYDEYEITIDDNETVEGLKSALNQKKLYSNERVFGMNLNRKYRKNFRYTFNCTSSKCQLTVSTPPADTLY